MNYERSSPFLLNRLKMGSKLLKKVLRPLNVDVSRDKGNTL